MNWAGVLLILVAVGLFVAEVKITSYGLLTVGGIVAMILGAMMLVDSPLPEFRPALGVARRARARLRRRGRRLLLRLVWRAQQQKPTTGREALVGQVGVRGDDSRSGRVGDRAGRALAGDGRAILWPPGERVRVVSCEGLLLRVQKEA